MNLKKKRHLFRNSGKWWLLSQYVFFLMRLFYRKIVVEGKENIPKDKPLIFAPNHQNALMDPLVILYATGMQTVFLARADIFRIKILRDIFSWLKIIPVYRIRDGKENLGNNDISFNIAVEVLENRRSVGIFPEAAHSNQRRLLPLRKGIPRLAFLAEEKNEFNLDLQVLPAGIYYSNYENMRSIVHVRFGKPIAVKDFREAHLENPQKSLLLLRDAIGAQLTDLSMDIRNQEYYDAIYSAAEIFAAPLLIHKGHKRHTQPLRFNVQKKMIAVLERNLEQDPESLGEFSSRINLLLSLLKEARLKWEFFQLPEKGVFGVFFSILLLLLTFPVFLYGFINNVLFYGSVKLLLKKFKDRQFHSSVKFMFGLLICPLFHLIQALVVLAISGSLFWSLVYLVSLPLTAFAARMWIGKFRKTWQYARLLYLKWFHRVKLTKIKMVYTEVLEDLKARMAGLQYP